MVEASGGFESPLVVALVTAGLPVCRVSPQRVRSFARALGELAKTDPLNARLLTRYGRDCRPPEYLNRTADYREMVWGFLYSPEHKLRFGPVPSF